MRAFVDHHGSTAVSQQSLENGAWELRCLFMCKRAARLGTSDLVSPQPVVAAPHCPYAIS
jgi:hypothetical protein